MPRGRRFRPESDDIRILTDKQSMIDVREKAARQFSARLTGRGFESWVREGNDTYVVGGQEYMP